MGPEGMLVRLVEHDDAPVDAQQLQAAYAFRPNALIDSASQPGILQVDHRGRAFMLADWSDAYATFVADWNGTLGWAFCTPAGVFTMYNPQKEFVLEMSTGQRGQMVFLEVGQMERERVQRHMYEVQWEQSAVSSGNVMEGGRAGDEARVLLAHNGESQSELLEVLHCCLLELDRVCLLYTSPSPRD